MIRSVLASAIALGFFIWGLNVWGPALWVTGIVLCSAGVTISSIALVITLIGLWIDVQTSGEWHW